MRTATGLLALCLAAGSAFAQSTTATAMSESEKAALRADAADRTSLDGHAGHDGSRFFIQSADGSYLLRFYGMVQGRYIGSLQEESGGDDDYAGGFEISRSRIGLSGHVIDESIKYFLLTGTGTSGSAFILDAWVQKVFGEHWAVKAGQFKTPFDREFLVSETRQQFVERSVVNARFNAGYVQGLLANFTSEHVRLGLSFNDGARTGSFYGGESTLGERFGVTARGEFKLGGDWEPYSDFCCLNVTEPTLVIGAAVHYQQGETLVGGGGSLFQDGTEILAVTGDVSFEYNKLGLNAFGHYRRLDDRPAGTPGSDEWGVVVQAGYFITDDIEVAARYEFGDLDSAATINEDLSILTIGATKFFAGHAAKVTADVGVAFDEVDPAWGGSSRGWRGSTSGDDDNQIVFRAQFQLIF